MKEFAAVFEGLDDPRAGNAKRHLLLEILMIALCTVPSGGETCADMALFGRVKRTFLKQFLTLPHGPPSHATFSRVSRLLDPAQFQACFVAFMRRFAETCEGVVAIDGKVLRRSFDAASSSSALRMVNAWACEQRLVLGPFAIDSKSNEITVVPKLLGLLALKGALVTADALNCQRATAEQIASQGGDYVLALKGNQGTLFDDVRVFLDDPATPLATSTETDAGHGRIEQRQASLASNVAWLQERHAWPGLQAIGKVTARRELRGKITVKTRSYLLSTALSPERFNQVVRSHWDIENGLHWVLDVVMSEEVMSEDQARNRKDHGPENLAVLRRLPINLVRLEASKGSLRGKLKRAGWDDAFLSGLLTHTTQPQMR